VFSRQTRTFSISLIDLSFQFSAFGFGLSPYSLIDAREASPTLAQFLRKKRPASLRKPARGQTSGL